MEFKINDRGETIRNIVRKIGYVLQDVVGDNGQYSLVREINKGNRYPRFHIYLKKDEENKWFVFDLHLDQKSASYEKSKTHAHSGEYRGEIVEKEAGRIKNILENS